MFLSLFSLILWEAHNNRKCEMMCCCIRLISHHIDFEESQLMDGVGHKLFVSVQQKREDDY